MKKLVIIPFIFLLTLLLGACGSSKSSSEEKSTLDKIKDKGELVIATSGDYRPFTYLGDDNKLTGYDIEWAKAIAKQMGVKPVFETGDFSGLIPGLNQGRFDMVMSSIHVTEERKKSLDFSDPYALDGAVAVVRKDSLEIADPTEIKGLKVGVNAGSNWETIVRDIGGFKELKTYPGPTESIADLINERIDTVVLGQASAAAYIKNAPDGNQIEISGKPLDGGEESHIVIALRKGDAELQEAVNKAIAELKEDGTYDELAMKYFGITFE
ncbi:substrate-binding periplasmic protein [Niallia nealsonii]|uniref:Solute-binding protein family 3/N-terminal domain-containing protein n=1 Tax=Niallia nealsonii TaxID=115979 RepID=A0A2N0Z5G6_9BACI|nr:transporter substrate-binding domain-containing protein [Niallia nealsonii]PKG24766.1 hypothetical protein CWS01_05835 [Niallia nealsonii]